MSCKRWVIKWLRQYGLADNPVQHTHQQKAIAACINVGHKPQDHFVQTAKMVSLGSGSQRKVKDYHLSRYACYLVIQNSDGNGNKPVGSR